MEACAEAKSNHIEITLTSVLNIHKVYLMDLFCQTKEQNSYNYGIYTNGR
jgi:hypothetical protein